MKFLTPLTLLLALQLCAPAAQVKKETSKTAPAPKVKTASARTIVCIDPGHPSEVASGKNVQNGTSENRTNWAVATKLRDELEARGYEVVMTKSAEDELVRNRDRALVANRARASLMIRLHCDASAERGFAVYYPDRAGRAKDGTRGPGPSVIEESRRAAEAVHSGLVEGL
ncbi:MAG TPA: N-acetylmuramoyl-L-alanine amidase, partial [Pyrinomonadaceae bacterium]|nr:N-acetylmuramoyl-L-alanine amidase [Pyrinomonadaceae bacterium]